MGADVADLSSFIRAFFRPPTEKHDASQEEEGREEKKTQPVGEARHGRIPKKQEGRVFGCDEASKEDLSS